MGWESEIWARTRAESDAGLRRVRYGWAVFPRRVRCEPAQSSMRGRAEFDTRSGLKPLIGLMFRLPHILTHRLPELSWTQTLSYGPNRRVFLGFEEE